MNRLTKTAWTGFLCAAATLAIGNAYAEEHPEDNPDTPARWVDFRDGTFKGRAIDTHADAVIKLDAPARAADGAVVPIAIAAQFPQTPARYIKKVYLFIDENPEPYAGSFEFTPDSGFATVETRVRVEDYTFMRVIAETNDGKLYSSVRFVKASGGCSAPAGKDDAAAEANAGLVRLTLQGPTVAGKPQLAQLMVRHPNRTGMAMNQVTRNYATAYFVRKVTVSYGGKPVMIADVNFSISENPNFRFWFVPRGDGELKAQVEDSKSKQFNAAIAVNPQAGAQQNASSKL
ncbi:quinoprotein dehydrogenase-associated SoxYZ-like carrier [Paraburkholderia rhizosphaerae]|uniref:Sulfur-oxidizing protein SoxY n=1 Tax=Paraburkholderia rhizosphaerae TaxID=480658 RepID=A0A4R8LX66_9BURK|nr:quinoprotein dehydrogenase-associated SoxYZ-like carrier [Paraburkholderia rhizosphaerae]TDY52262.1 sulfur-oxidizing protein SoxY [Paraburkholderia rhizosphaerae]